MSEDGIDRGAPIFNFGEIDVIDACSIPSSGANHEAGGATGEKTSAPSSSQLFIHPEHGELRSLDIKVCCNTKGDIMRDQVKAALARGWPAIGVCQPLGRTAIMVGGGPSLATLWPEIEAAQKDGAAVFALNAAARFLNARGVTPDYQVFVDPRAKNVEMIGEARCYLAASQCHPEFLDALAARVTPSGGSPDDTPASRITLFHMIGSAANIVNGTVIGGDITVGLAGIMLAFTMGHRTIRLYGYDSSYASGEHHAYAQAQTEQESKTLEVLAMDCDGSMRPFTTNFAMAKQAELFPQAAGVLCDAGATITIHGDGLLQTIARGLARRSLAEEMQNPNVIIPRNLPAEAE